MLSNVMNLEYKIYVQRECSPNLPTSDLRTTTMFDISTHNLRLRAFNAATDLDHLYSQEISASIAPLMTKRFIVPEPTSFKMKLQKEVEEDAEMFCIIETLDPVTIQSRRTTAGHLTESNTNTTASNSPNSEINTTDQTTTSTTYPAATFIGATAFWKTSSSAGMRHVSFSIVLGPNPDFLSRGYGRIVTQFMVDYAFQQLNMHRVSLEVFEGNERALRCYERCGFIVEGRQRKSVWRNGGWIDVIQMGMLDEDWRKRNIAN